LYYVGADVILNHGDEDFVDYGKRWNWKSPVACCIHHSVFANRKEMTQSKKKS
jgi:hypothetical protein